MLRGDSHVPAGKFTSSGICGYSAGREVEGLKWIVGLCVDHICNQRRELTYADMVVETITYFYQNTTSFVRVTSAVLSQPTTDAKAKLQKTTHIYSHSLREPNYNISRAVWIFQNGGLNPCQEPLRHRDARFGYHSSPPEDLLTSSTLLRTWNRQQIMTTTAQVGITQGPLWQNGVEWAAR